MDVFADKLGAVGAWCAGNKYLSAIKNAFQNFMPATIAGAVCVVWTCVVVNSGSGLGIFFKPIMALEPFNAVFGAVQNATIGFIAVAICMLVGQEIAEANGEKGSAYPAVLAFIMWITVTPLSHGVTGLTAGTDAAGAAVSIKAVLEAAGFDAAAAGTFGGISTSYTGATGLFTGLIIGIAGIPRDNQFFIGLQAVVGIDKVVHPFFGGEARYHTDITAFGKPVLFGNDTGFFFYRSVDTVMNEYRFAVVGFFKILTRAFA